MLFIEKLPSMENRFWLYVCTVVFKIIVVRVLESSQRRNIIYYGQMKVKSLFVEAQVHDSMCIVHDIGKTWRVKNISLSLSFIILTTKCL